MTTEQPLTVICRYVVKPGKEAEMETLLGRHWPALRDAGLVTADPPVIYRGLASNKEGGRHGAERTYVEIFAWKNEKSPELAHQTPEIMAVWEPMGGICEDMDFPHFETIDPVQHG